MIGGPFVVFFDGKRSRSLPWFGERNVYGVAEQLNEGAALEWINLEPFVVQYVGPPSAIVRMTDGTTIGLWEALARGFVRRNAVIPDLSDPALRALPQADGDDGR